MRSLRGLRREVEQLNPPPSGCANCPPVWYERYDDDDPPDEPEARPCLLRDPSKCCRSVAVVEIRMLGANRDGTAGRSLTDPAEEPK